jgi:hypothetical protein
VERVVSIPSGGARLAQFVGQIIDVVRPLGSGRSAVGGLPLWCVLHTPHHHGIRRGDPLSNAAPEKLSKRVLRNADW